MAGEVHPVPFRTRKLSPPAPMVLRSKSVGEQDVADQRGAFAVDRRQTINRSPGVFLFIYLQCFGRSSYKEFLPLFISRSFLGLAPRFLMRAPLFVPSATRCVQTVEPSPAPCGGGAGSVYYFLAPRTQPTGRARDQGEP